MSQIEFYFEKVKTAKKVGKIADRWSGDRHSCKYDFRCSHSYLIALAEAVKDHADLRKGLEPRHIDLAMESIINGGIHSETIRLASALADNAPLMQTMHDTADELEFYVASGAEADPDQRLYVSFWHAVRDVNKLRKILITTPTNDLSFSAAAEKNKKRLESICPGWFAQKAEQLEHVRPFMTPVRTIFESVVRGTHKNWLLGRKPDPDGPVIQEAKRTLPFLTFQS